MEGPTAKERHRKRYIMQIDKGLRFYGAQWAKYKGNEQKLTPQFEREFAEYMINGKMALAGILPPNEWKVIEKKYLNKWRAYKYWMDYQKYLQWQKTQCMRWHSSNLA